MSMSLRSLKPGDRVRATGLAAPGSVALGEPARHIDTDRAATAIWEWREGAPPPSAGCRDQ